MSGQASDIFSQLSDAMAGRVASGAAILAAIGIGNGRYLSGIVWRPDAIVTSEQALPKRETYDVTLAGGARVTVRLAGRDPGTNVAVLRPDTPIGGAGSPATGAEARTGTLALALGAHPEPRARLALIQVAGPAWDSMAGGHIDRLIRLDMRSSPIEEGGPVLDQTGGVLGMATAGPRSRALVIPHATIARVVEPLLAEGRVPRGWLGVGLQPVSVPEALREPAGQESGLMVVSLAAGGPAEQAGVLPGDILLSLGGERLNHPRAIRAALRPDRVGSQAALRLLRAGALHTCSVTIGTRPAG